MRGFLDGIAKKLGISSEDRIIKTLAKTTAIRRPRRSRWPPITALEEHRNLSEGDLVLMEAMGGGFTWGAALVRGRLRIASVCPLPECADAVNGIAGRNTALRKRVRRRSVACTELIINSLAFQPLAHMIGIDHLDPSTS